MSYNSRSRISPALITGFEGVAGDIGHPRNMIEKGRVRSV